MSTFLELVNDAIYESKVTLDPLTSLNFANPPRTMMYDRFKRWINVAYKELLMDNKDWYFSVERASVVVWPRLQLSGLTYTPSPGDILEGSESGVRFTIVAVHPIEDVEGDSLQEKTVSVTFADSHDPADFILLESINRISPDPLNGVAKYKGSGFYDFSEQVEQLRNVDMSSFRINGVYGDDTTFIRYPDEGFPLVPIDYSNYAYFDPYVWTRSTPRYITQTPYGLYDMYPHMMNRHIVSFDFQRSIPQLVEWDDEPSGIPEHLQEYLVWRAVEEYADFDSNQKVFARAHKHVLKYEMYMNRDEQPPVRFEASRFEYPPGTTRRR